MYLIVHVRVHVHWLLHLSCDSVSVAVHAAIWSVMGGTAPLSWGSWRPGSSSPTRTATQQLCWAGPVSSTFSGCWRRSPGEVQCTCTCTCTCTGVYVYMCMYMYMYMNMYLCRACTLYIVHGSQSAITQYIHVHVGHSASTLYIWKFEFPIVTTCTCVLYMYAHDLVLMTNFTCTCTCTFLFFQTLLQYLVYMYTCTCTPPPPPPPLRLPRLSPLFIPFPSPTCIKFILLCSSLLPPHTLPMPCFLLLMAAPCTPSLQVP